MQIQTAQVTLPAHVIATDLDEGQGVLIDVQSKQYFQLNETGLLIWRGLERGLDKAQIIDEMTAQYEVDADRAAASIDRLLGELRERKLINAD